jgi:GNAT superfamily N-acetyltransferase
LSLRKAENRDLPAIASLASQKRGQYEKYQPLFHKESPRALEAHTAFLRDSLSKDNVIPLVHETDGPIDGFIIGAIVAAPPVYEPGGKVCFVDDFMVERPELWATVGRELLKEVLALAGARGAVLANVVCGPLDQAKKEMLSGENFDVASEWHVKPINT